MLSVTGRGLIASHAQELPSLDLQAATLLIDRDARQLCAGLTEQQLSWSPDPTRWTIAQNLAHLRGTTEVFLPAIDAALALSRTLNLRGDGPFPLSLYGRIIVWQMEARPIKLKSPKAVEPCLLSSPSEELPGFLRAQCALRERIEAAAGLDLTARRFPSPLLSCFHVNLLELFSLFNAHARRHLRQANRLRHSLPLA